MISKSSMSVYLKKKKRKKGGDLVNHLICAILEINIARLREQKEW